MKNLLIAIILFIYSSDAFSLEPREDFNIALLEIYNSLASSGDSQELIGKEFTALLTLKFASEKYLIFSDTYIKTDDTESYQIAKWQFSSDVIQSAIGKSNVKLNVTFRVLNVRKEQPYKDMPHITATVLKMSPSK